MGWWSVRGSVRISRRGSSKFFWIWLVKVPARQAHELPWAHAAERQGWGTCAVAAWAQQMSTEVTWVT